MFELAHRPLGAEQATFVEIEADSSWEAVETIRSRIPENEHVLYVRNLGQPATPTS